MEYLIGAAVGYIICHFATKHALVDYISRGAPIEVKGTLYKLEELK